VPETWGPWTPKKKKVVSLKKVYQKRLPFLHKAGSKMVWLSLGERLFPQGVLHLLKRTIPIMTSTFHIPQGEKFGVPTKEKPLIEGENILGNDMR